jgi:hypothetical protein
MYFIHNVTWRLNDVEYVRRRVSKNPDLLLAKDDLSLIVSASLAWGGDSSMLKMLLDLGASPNEQVEVRGEEQEFTASAWMIFCICFAATMIGEEADRCKDRLCGRLEQFLATGVVDTNCVILVASGRRPQDYEGPPTHRISLRQLVQQLKPANGDSLLKMMTSISLSSSIISTWHTTHHALSHQVQADRSSGISSQCCSLLLDERVYFQLGTEGPKSDRLTANFQSMFVSPHTAYWLPPGPWLPKDIERIRMTFLVVVGDRDLLMNQEQVRDTEASREKSRWGGDGEPGLYMRVMDVLNIS